MQHVAPEQQADSSDAEPPVSSEGLQQGQQALTWLGPQGLALAPGCCNACRSKCAHHHQQRWLAAAEICAGSACTPRCLSSPTRFLGCWLCGCIKQVWQAAVATRLRRFQLRWELTAGTAAEAKLVRRTATFCTSPSVRSTRLCHSPVLHSAVQHRSNAARLCQPTWLASSGRGLPAPGMPPPVWRRCR